MINSPFIWENPVSGQFIRTAGSGQEREPEGVAPAQRGIPEVYGPEGENAAQRVLGRFSARDNPLLSIRNRGCRIPHI
jgi:hypothetical protein